jgi:hypothetical protein
MSTINHLYNNTVDLIFESGRHQYTYGDKKVKSVTGILGIISKPFLVPWAAKITTEKMAELLKPGVSYDEIQIKEMLETSKKAHYNAKVNAGDIGTLVHNYLSDVILKKHPGALVHQEANNAAQRFMDWVATEDVEFLLSEQVVFSKKYNFCGTLDFVCRIGDKLMLGDIKTSNQISKVEYGAQMAAYTIARQEEFPDERYDGAILIRVGKKDAEFEAWQIDDVEPYKKIFLNCLELQNSIYEVEPPRSYY